MKRTKRPVIDGKKVCSSCLRNLPTEEFYLSKRNGRIVCVSRCKGCTSRISAEKDLVKNGPPKTRKAPKAESGSSEKGCSKCQKILPLSDFYTSGSVNRSGYSSWCKECVCEAAKERQERDKWKRIEKQYGITKAQYEEMWDRQCGECAICDGTLTSEDPRFEPVIDHDHVTNKVRGILCRKCNMGIGIFNDMGYKLGNAVAYLSYHAGKHFDDLMHEERNGRRVDVDRFKRTSEKVYEMMSTSRRIDNQAPRENAWPIQ